MRLDEFAPMMTAADRGDLLNEVVGITQRLGFEKVTAMVVVDHCYGETDFLSVFNTPAAYLDIATSKDLMRRDPVMQHCRRNNIPIIWNRDTYVAAGRVDQWEVQAQLGYCSGIALALHLPEGRHFMIGVDRDRPLPSNPSEVARRVAHLQLFAAYAQDAALRILAPPSQPPMIPVLTARELEALRWTMDGKTAWEVGAILKINERTAARHINNATQKLGCMNKLQAVVKALRLGLMR